MFLSFLFLLFSSEAITGKQPGFVSDTIDTRTHFGFQIRQVKSCDIFVFVCFDSGPAKDDKHFLVVY